MRAAAARCVGLFALAACLLWSTATPASADILSPFLVPSLKDSVTVLSTRSHAQGINSMVLTLEQLADPHGAIAFISINDALYSMFISRVVEVAVLGDPALQSFALRYSNGSVELATPTVVDGFRYSSEWLQGPYSAMANGQSHFCFLLESGFVECRAAAAPVPGFNVSSGALMQQRAGVRFAQISAANAFTCALRFDDSKVECFGDVSPDGSSGSTVATRMSLNSSLMQYSVIATEYPGGWCGLTLISRDLYCWSVHNPIESLALPAPAAPLSWRAPFFSGVQTQGCALRSDGHFACNWTDGLILDPNPYFVDPLSDVTAWNARLSGAMVDTGQVIEYSNRDVNTHPNDFAFIPIQFIGIDATQGNDSACGRASTLSPMELRSHIPCQTLAGALRIAHYNSWIQLLPGTHFGGDLTVGFVDITLSSQPPPFLTASEIASIGNGSWTQRMAEAAALDPAAVLDCTGFTHCMSSNYVRLSLVGLTLTGSSEHAIVHNFIIPGVVPNEPDLTLLNCTFSVMGGVLKKRAGEVLIRGCLITDSTQNENVRALIDIAEADTKIEDTRFERHSFLDVLDTDPAVRSCVRITADSSRVIAVTGCSWNDCHSKAPRTTIGAEPMVQGGVALQFVVSAASAVIKDCSFTNQTTSALAIFGGAVAFIVSVPTYPNPTVELTVDSCVFQSCSAIAVFSYGLSQWQCGGGGGLAVSESDPQGSISNDVLKVGPAVTIINSQFSDCSTAPFGGAMYLTAAMTSLTVTDVTITRCSATYGGALGLIQAAPHFLLFGQFNFEFTRVSMSFNNASATGGSMHVSNVNTRVVMTHCTFVGSSSFSSGGSMYVEGSRLFNLVSVRFEQSSGSEGGAIWVTTTQRLFFEDSEFVNCTAIKNGGALYATFTKLTMTTVPFTDCSLRAASAPLPGAFTRAGGAIRLIGGAIDASGLTFTRCTALPTTMSLASCAESYDPASGFSSEGNGGSIAADLSSVGIGGISVSGGRACTGGFISVNGGDAEDLIDVSDVVASDMEAFSAGVGAFRAVTTVFLTGYQVSASSARSVGGAFVMSEIAHPAVLLSDFRDVSCTPLHSGESCDGGVVWVTSQRKSVLFLAYSSFTDVQAAGAGAAVFHALPSVTATALANVLPFEDITLEDALNTFASEALQPPFAQYGQVQASGVVNLTAAVTAFRIYPGQLFDAALPDLAIITIDAFGQACTMDRSLVVAIEAVGAEAASVTFTGTVLQKVQAASGAANFSSGDLRISAPPGDYTLRFSVVSLPDLSIDVALSVTDSCPAGLFYSVGLRSCVSCPSDLVVYNSTLNACEQCMAGWQRAAPSAAAANATGGPLNDGVLCEVCPLGSVSTSGSRCAPCPPNTYQPTAFAACVQCSEIAGLQCAGDGLAQIQAGYFALSVPDGAGGSLIETFQCPEGFCSAARVQVTAATAVSANLASSPPSSSSAVNSYDQCAFPRLASPTNLLCGECAEGYRPWGNRCSRCDSVDGGLLFGLIVLSLALLAWLIRSSLGSPSAGHAVVVLYFVQTAMLELGSLNSLLAWLNVVLLSPNSVGRCVAPLSPYQQTQAQILMPVALWIELCIIALIHFVAFKRWGALSAQEGSVSSAASLPARLRASALHFTSRFSVDLYVSATLSLLLFSYTQVAVACVTYLRCVSVGGTAVVFSQPTMRCESDEYAQTRGLVVFALIAYVAGLPVGIAAFLWRRSDAVREAHAALAVQAVNARRVSTAPEGELALAAADSSGVTAAAAPSAVVSPATAHFLLRYAPLFAMYSSSAWFWQVIVLCRRTAFVVISVLLLPTPRRRFVAFALSTLVSSLLQLVFAPFRLSVFNRVELGSQSLLLVLSITLTLEDPPFSAGVEAFIFLLVVVPLCVYALWAAGATIVGAKLDRDRVYAAKEKEQLELESAIDSGLTRNPSIALHARPEVGVEMLSPSAVSSDVIEQTRL